MWKRTDDYLRGNVFASKLAKKKKKKKISFYKNFCFKFGTIVIIILFIDVERCGR